MHDFKHFSTLCSEIITLPVYKLKEQKSFLSFGEVTHITYYNCGNV